MKKRYQKGAILMQIIVTISTLAIIIYSYYFLSSNTSFLNQLKFPQIQEQNLVKNPNTSYFFEIRSPKTGDTLYIGNVCEINWTSQNINAVSFYLAKQGSSNVTEIIIEKIQASTGKFFWTIPANNNEINLGGQFKILAMSEEVSNSPISETSWFTIVSSAN